MEKLRRLLGVVGFTFFSFVAFAQNVLVKGTIINQSSNDPIPDATITVASLKVLKSTDANGQFTLSNVPSGTYDAVISTDGFNSFEVKISVNDATTVLDPIYLNLDAPKTETFVNDISALDFDDASSSESGGAISSGQNISSVLNASRDPFLSAATFGWGQFFYRMRGYDNDQSTLFLNGIPMNDLEEGGVFYNSYSGLNDVFRSRSMNLGLQANDHAFGGYGLNTNIDASASTQRDQTRLSYSSTNRNYRNRLMLTHSSGLNKKGWAYSFSLSRRWAEHGPIKGTFYDAFGYFAAVEKKYKNHSINLMAVGAPLKRGKNGPSTAEAFDLAGTTYYNPYWGYQGDANKGNIRNSRVFKSNMPLFILSDKWKLKPNTMLSAAISYQTGETSTTTFDWYNAADPRPDYYRYLPSYTEDATERQLAIDKIQSNPEEFLQVKWNNIYAANAYSVKGGDGRAAYILGADVEGSRKINANINLQSFISEHITVNGGFIYQNQKNHNYRRVDDLLGATYWLNINQFAERDFSYNPDAAQLDLENPNQRKTVGDTYGYNYNVFFKKSALFGQVLGKYNKVDFFVAGELGNTNFYREGLYRHGLYPENSLGASVKQNFNTYRVKGGVTYKINGRNYVYANGAIGTQAPFVDNVLISGRTRNQFIPNPSVEKIQTAEVGYLLRSPNFKARLTGYVTEVNNATDIKRYFHDDFRSFTNMSLQGLNKRFTGIEMGAEVKISSSLSLNLAANLSQAFYTSRAFVQEFIDNDTSNLANVNQFPAYDTAYINNYFIPTGPQTALQANLFYRSKKFWFGSLTVNYLANKWLDFAPTSRTIQATDVLDRNSPEFATLTKQLEVEPFMTFDAFFGKSFKLNQYLKKAPSSSFLFLNVGLSNILNKQDIVLYGFENLRAGTIATDRLNEFGPRYAYNLGFQYFLNIAITF